MFTPFNLLIHKMVEGRCGNYCHDTGSNVLAHSDALRHGLSQNAEFGFYRSISYFCLIMEVLLKDLSFLTDCTLHFS